MASQLQQQQAQASAAVLGAVVGGLAVGSLRTLLAHLRPAAPCPVPPAAAVARAAGEEEGAVVAEPSLESLAAAYRRDGFVKLSQLLSPAEVEQWRAAVDGAVGRQLARSGGEYHNKAAAVDVASGDYANQGADAGYYRTVFVQVRGVP